MQSQESTQGKWLDTVCNKRNQVVCQLGQSQQPIDELRRLIQQTQQQVEQLQQHIQVLETNYNQLAENPVPVGFIYVQLGQQQRPQHLWPQSSIKWYDITQQYAGLFFRAEGPDSAKFGEIQPANWSRLSTIRTRSCYTPDHGSYCEEFTTELGDTGGWSPEFIRKDFSNDMYFYVTTGLDNRPRNQAIRIYKRIA
ncbi:uncharacterized protein LOC128953396 [Oppia nitens]|uniref:uncharacterized protein LOC128953396 n=1 Tax=Oppia nitens TaxID=1686743 RepID=UPI0023DA5D5F|nr:uncharacterized protein LOC128953396 [Oppia nitens]